MRELRVDKIQDVTGQILGIIPGVRRLNGWREEAAERHEKELKKIKETIRGLPPKEIARIPKALLEVLFELEIIDVKMR